VSLRAGGGLQRGAGTSAATALISGVAALMWSLFPQASTADITYALAVSSRTSRRQLIPPPLDAKAAYFQLKGIYRDRSYSPQRNRERSWSE
jgi:hypothetical protein